MARQLSRDRVWYNVEYLGEGQVEGGLEGTAAAIMRGTGPRVIHQVLTT